MQLIQFARSIKHVEHVDVLVCTQPFEPLTEERLEAVRRAAPFARVRHFDQEIEQDPTAPGFWERWREILIDQGVGPDTWIVASEPYGQRLAETTGARFMPYDVGRELNDAKATRIRERPDLHFDKILPEFRRHLRTTVTVFGAESTGKTTLSRAIASEWEPRSTWLYEWARPYLESTVNEITRQTMTEIWLGQRALQLQVDNLRPTPLVVQDTDLYSTVGYWQLPHWTGRLGSPPPELVDDARRLRSDLYVLTQSNVPFEPDPLRYGGDRREGSDEYWINVCERYSLPYVVLSNSDHDDRVREARELVEQTMRVKLRSISYDRRGL